MVFIKLLGVLALIVALAIAFLSLPNIAAYRLSVKGSKIKELPICVMTAVLAVGVILYSVFKNTFWGFVFAWSSVFVLFCGAITVIRYYRGRKKYCRKYYVSYPKNYIMIANFAVVILLAAVVLAIDNSGAKIPARSEIECVYFSVDPLEIQQENGCLNPDYAVINPDLLEKTVKKVTDLDIDDDTAGQVAANLGDAATDIYRDDSGIDEIITLCKEMNHGFFKQEFSRKFRTTETDNEKLYVYAFFKLTNGKIVSRRYEYGDRNIAVSTLETDSAATASEKLTQLQHRIENPESSVTEMGVYYHSGGTNISQVFLYSYYEPVMTALKTDAVQVSSERQEPSLIRMCVYCENSFAVPPIYSAFGIPNRTTTDYYNIYKTNTSTWNEVSSIVNGTN